MAQAGDGKQLGDALQETEQEAWSQLIGCAVASDRRVMGEGTVGGVGDGPGGRRVSGVAHGSESGVAPIPKVQIPIKLNENH